jgi:hypothetical protein
MLHYPKMPGSEKAPIGKRCVAFEKLDGTNLHFAWDRDFGWHRFGTRRDAFNRTEAGRAAFDAAHPELAGADLVFAEMLEESASRVLETLGVPEAVLFAEYLGENSFAGRHRETDTKRLVVFDIELPTGFLDPEEFLKVCQHLPTPRVVYRGKLTGQFTEDVRRGKFGVDEGVVCKGLDGSWRCKVKTNTYLQRLKDAFATDWESYWE